MSFAKDAKLEILNNKIEDDSSAIAFLSGLFHAAGEISKNSDGLHASIITDVKQIYEYVNDLVQKLYGDFLDLEIEDDFKINKTTYYKISFPDAGVTRILEDIGVLERDGTGYNLIFKINPNIILEDNSKKHFVKGAFVGTGTSSIKISTDISVKTTSGYHLEFTSHSYEFLSDLSSLLAEYEICSKLIQRKNTFVLYIKEAGSVQNLLALMEANEAVITLCDEMVARELRNKVNRETNCLSANISKTVDASMRQVEAIEEIIDIIGLDALPQDLQEVALLRLANQEESLQDLLKLSTIKLTKSGLNHRFNKLLKIAKELKE